MPCECGDPPVHKVWCKVRADRRRRKAEEAKNLPKKPTAAQRRQAEHAKIVRRATVTRALYDAGVRGMGRHGP